ncbi:hypothetical protein [Streptomyces sp. NPDC000410]|uniref:hypothetical protein n=1 Tax=Streptomyces sp. NPDC000410 TaxID=3154254 RepID=UPI00332CA6C8
MARSSSGPVAALAATAIAVIGFLAYQASANVPAGLRNPAAATSPATLPAAEKHPREHPLTVPANSGGGMRVVYSLSERRVWLVDAHGRSTRTFLVMPSPISPPPGRYDVTSRSGSIQGSDGVRIEHVVRFANVDNVTIGFSAAVDGSMSSPDPDGRTGGVRMKRADGNAMWTFATVGSKIIVVP